MQTQLRVMVPTVYVLWVLPFVLAQTTEKPQVHELRGANLVLAIKTYAPNEDGSLRMVSVRYVSTRRKQMLKILPVHVTTNISYTRFVRRSLRCFAARPMDPLYVS